MGTSVLGDRLAARRPLVKSRPRKEEAKHTKDYGCPPHVELGVAHETTPQLVAMSSGVLPEASTP
jgi:hypothetical protein